MDSGNSGSIQSSSGGDEDYDSRAADDSSFNNPSSTTTTTTNPLLFSHSSTMFDPLSNYFNPPILTQSDQTNQTSMNTNMPTWSKPQPNPFFTPMAYTQHSQTIGGGTTTTSAATTTTTSGNNNQDQSSQSAVVSGARNPKKRSRASRRAPTTVLTTDTSNFRAMVQEFTGIPSPPFTSSSPFPRTRLDLFTSPTTLSTSSFRSPPSTFHHNLLRPFPHKIQPQLSTFTNNNNQNINTISTAAAAASTTSPSAILKQPPQRSCNDHNYILNNMQIQNLAFESFLPQPSSNDDQEFGLPSHTQVNTNLLRNISNKNNNGSDLNYAASGSSNLNFLGEKELVADDHHDHNVSASASTTRGEGLMESWICSSD